MISAAGRERDRMTARYSGSATSFWECFGGVVVGPVISTALQAFFDYADHHFVVLRVDTQSPHFVKTLLRVNLDVVDEQENEASENDLEQHEYDE